MEVDFIKWMVDYAEGFEMEKDQVCNPANYMYTLSDFGADYKKDLWEFTDYPLLLQRAIEGINKAVDKYCIIQTYNTIVVTQIWDLQTLLTTKDIGDQAKEAALKYIYEQEKDNGEKI